MRRPIAMYARYVCVFFVLSASATASAKRHRHREQESANAPAPPPAAAPAPWIPQAPDSAALASPPASAPAATVPTAAAPESTPPSTVVATPSPADDPTSVAAAATDSDHPTAVFIFGAEAASRQFTYQSAQTTTLTPYSSGLAPLLAVGVSVYPAAQTKHFWRDLGLGAAYETSVDLVTHAAGTSLVTAWTRADVDLRYRIHFKAQGGPQLIILAGMGREEFAFATTSTMYPASTYKFARFGVDFMLPLGPVRLLADASLAPFFAGNALNQTFSAPQVHALSAAAGIGWSATPQFSLQLRLAYTQYAFSFQPRTGDALVATGAADSMWRTQVAAVQLF